MHDIKIRNSKATHNRALLDIFKFHYSIWNGVGVDFISSGMANFSSSGET